MSKMCIYKAQNGRNFLFRRDQGQKLRATNATLSQGLPGLFSIPGTCTAQFSENVLMNE